MPEEQPELTIRQVMPGMRFGRWTVICRVPVPPKQQPRFSCICDCGTKRNVLYQLLRRGWSCGCAKATQDGKSKTREGKVWVSMVQRCTNDKDPSYPNYGGRGIQVCDRWRWSLQAFCEDMGPRPKGTFLERMNNDGNYEPGNCRWASWIEQQRNKRTNHWITALGVTRCLTEWQEQTGISMYTIFNRIKKLGWPPDEAVSVAPSRVSRKFRSQNHA